MSRPFFHGFILVMIVTGLAVALLRHADTGVPFIPGERTPVWTVEARIDFIADGGPVLLSMNLPDDPPGFRVSLEQTASPGYGFSIVEHDGNRRGEWTVREAAGRQTLYYKVQVISDRSAADAGGLPPPDTIDAVIWDGPEATAAEQLLADARLRSSSVESLTRELIKLLAAPQPAQNAALLLSGHRSAELLEKLLLQAGIPTHVSMGLVLEDARRNQSLIPVVEVYANGRWITFDPQSGRQGTPEDLLLWHRGGRSLIDLVGGAGAHAAFSMIRQQVPALELARVQVEESGFSLVSMHRLPIEEQSVFRLLLLLPLGALVTVFMRIMVGVRTSGTFMPVLIALAFLQTSLVPGLINFIAIVALGLMLRSYLSHLNLLSVARIATIIVIVIFIIGMMSLVGYQLGFNTGMTVAFFPIIIIAWTIERMSILWEEDGPREVFVQGSGSLVVAIAAYLLMQHPLAAHLSFNFPELNLVVVALIMLIGQYTGYRLSELRRFRDLEGRP
jgi:hypothetical protein